MQSTLKQYAEDALRNRGLDHVVRDSTVQEVIASLVEREEAGANFMVMAGQDMGGNVGLIQEAYIDSGLFVPDPQPEQTTPVEETEEAPAWARSLIQRVDTLAQLAQDRFGVRV